jgi:cbb3-type cytochrome oxidase maturation protein
MPRQSVALRRHMTPGAYSLIVDILLLLIPLSVVLALLVGAGFWWSVKSGQFDDLEGPAHRILADDDRPAPTDEQKPAPQALTSVNSGGAGKR